MNTQQIWEAVLGDLELTLSKANFTTWFKGTFIFEIDDKKIFIGVPNAFTKSWLEKKYGPELLKALRNITELNLKEIAFKVATKKELELKEADLPLKINGEEKISFCKIPAPSSQVASNAYGHEILKNSADKKVLYITCEKFTNDFINSISSGKAANFKDIYRSVDMLLIDDVQFLAGKEGTQEEFFHTFNTLHQNNKQVILTSDRPPKSIPALENRLLSRFEWGMIADISQPDLETRLAILEAKSQEKNYQVNRDILNYLAANIASNIRELEGALNRIIAYHQLNAIVPTLESVKKLLACITTNLQKKSLTPKDIILVVSNYYDVIIQDLLGPSREKKLGGPRQIIMYLMRVEIKSSFPTIGDELGGRDHTTAMHAGDKIRNDYDNDEKIRREIEQLRQRLYNL